MLETVQKIVPALLIVKNLKNSLIRILTILSILWDLFFFGLSLVFLILGVNDNCVDKFRAWKLKSACVGQLARFFFSGIFAD